VTAPVTPTQPAPPIPAACCLEVGEIAVLWQVLQDPLTTPAERDAIHAWLREGQQQ
jgi:hypothetical protein